jgi:hypothetical protein
MSLRNSKLGKQDTWTRDQIIDGIKRFIEINKRFPKAQEFDSFDYLPSARSVQRSFGGLLDLKKELGIIEDYHRGTYRSEIAFRINSRSLNIETDLGTFLDSEFGEVCVHRERRASPENKERLDFVVYTKEGRFGVDVFYASNTHSLKGCLLIKSKKYLNFSDPLFFVSANKGISQEEINFIVSQKISPMGISVEALTMDEFKSRVVRGYTKLVIY